MIETCLHLLSFMSSGGDYHLLPDFDWLGRPSYALHVLLRSKFRSHCDVLDVLV